MFKKSLKDYNLEPKKSENAKNIYFRVDVLNELFFWSYHCDFVFLKLWKLLFNIWHIEWLI